MMQVDPLGLRGVYRLRPKLFPDSRGYFTEIFQQSAFQENVGHRLEVEQVNCSVSRRGTIRGIHATTVPPGQARYVTCSGGTVLDIVVDVRAGSPTFGQHVSVELSEEERTIVYLAEGLGHAFAPLTDKATVIYLCSSGYDPTREVCVNPLDPALGLPWPTRPEPLLSDKDRAAPTLQEALERGLLPSYDSCVARHESLRELSRSRTAAP
ncbi:dTDP-4-dehydrorhamnose 3,5-epimerase family protein [Nonomuraea sp. NPDC059007]|uniref:dTDP-4-dehydrorhamnose 3,5-epimerase family protein n=1 Tax=Nonomuraea sp. NPDC059007 TaxID=3346692 RepID=UPI0036998E83